MKKALLISLVSLFTFASLFVIEYQKHHDGLLHIVFCNVGQGDAVLIKTPQGKAILFDAGPDDAVLSCVSDHLPFWQRSINLVILSHPHADHFRGLFDLLERYNVEQFVSEDLDNNITEYKAIKQMISEKGIKKRFILRGDRIRLQDKVSITFLGPDQAFLKATSPKGMVGESKEFASLTAILQYGSFTMLLTGDTQSEQLQQDISASNIRQIDVLQSPHHGSGTGLTAEIVQLLDPKLAVISVGKNRYGHPSKKTLELLKDRKVLRTDKAGDVEIVTDGQKWWVRN